MNATGEQRERIVVGVDSSPAGAAALAWAVEESRRRVARLDAVIAWRPTATIAPPAGHPSASSRSLAERREDAEELLELALQEVSTEGVEIERRAMRGSPHRVLLDAARDAALLVIGGRSGLLGGSLPWSTGRQVVHDADCPVVVVPAQARAKAPPPQRPGVASQAAGARGGLAGGGQLPA